MEGQTIGSVSAMKMPNGAIGKKWRLIVSFLSRRIQSKFQMCFSFCFSFFFFFVVFVFSLYRLLPPPLLLLKFLFRPVSLEARALRPAGSATGRHQFGDISNLFHVLLPSLYCCSNSPSECILRILRIYLNLKT